MSILKNHATSVARRLSPQNCDREPPSSFSALQAISVSAGDNHSLYVSEDRALFTWGFGESGALGLGEVEALPTANSAGDVTQPTEVDAELIAGGGHGAEVLQAAAGSQHTVILAL